MKKKLSFWERIFGFYNESRHRVICLFGLKIKIRSKYLMLRNKVAALEEEKVSLHKTLDIQRLNHKELSCKHTAFEDKVSDLMQAYEGRLRAYVAQLDALQKKVTDQKDTMRQIEIRLADTTSTSKKSVTDIARLTTSLTTSADKYEKSLKGLREEWNSRYDAFHRELHDGLERVNKNATDGIQKAKLSSDRLDAYKRDMQGLYNQRARLTKVGQMYGAPQINREAVESEFSMLRKCGINKEEKRDAKVIISLTSYPERMYDIHLCLYSLLTQSFKPDAIILWLAHEQFPNGLEDVPQKVLNLRQWGVTIKWCEDYRSYKKLIPALREYPEDIIVTADDDLYYASDWLQVLWDEFLRSDKKSLIAHRCHKVACDGEKFLPYAEWPKCICDHSISFLNFCTNGGGTLFPPGSLAEDICDYEKIKQTCPNGDDIWIWGMAVLRGTKIRVVHNPHAIRYTNPARELNLNGDTTLWSSNRHENDAQICKLIEKYPQILDIVKVEK